MSGKERLVPLSDWLTDQRMVLQFGDDTVDVVPGSGRRPSETGHTQERSGVERAGGIKASESREIVPTEARQSSLGREDSVYQPGAGTDTTLAAFNSLVEIAKTVKAVHEKGSGSNSAAKPEPKIIEQLSSEPGSEPVSHDFSNSSPSTRGQTEADDPDGRSTGGSRAGESPVSPLELGSSLIYDPTSRRRSTRTIALIAGSVLVVAGVGGIAYNTLTGVNGQQQTTDSDQPPTSLNPSPAPTSITEPSPTDIPNQDLVTAEQIFPTLELGPASMIPVARVDVVFDADTGWNFTGVEGDFKRTDDGSTRLNYTSSLDVFVDVSESPDAPGIEITDDPNSDVRDVTVNLANCKLSFIFDTKSYEDELWGDTEPVEFMNQIINGQASPAVLNYLVDNGFMAAGDTPGNVITRYQEMKDDAIYLANAHIIEKILETEEYRRKLYTRAEETIRTRLGLNDPRYRVTFVEAGGADPTQVPQQSADYLANTNPSAALVEIPDDGNDYQILIGTYTGQDTATSLTPAATSN